MSVNLPQQGNPSSVTDPPLDTDTLEGLRELGDGDPSFLIEVIQQFLHDAPDHLKAIQQSVTDGNADSLMKAAHSFKGSCRNMGALSLGEHCMKLEEKGRNGEMEELNELLAMLDQEYPRVQLALETELTVSST